VQVQSAAAVLRQTQEQLRALTASLFRAQEDERRWVARELHDAVSQKLALLDMGMQRLEERLGGDGAPALAQVAELRERAAGLVDEVRRLSHRLHPSILDDLGLAPALRALVEDFGRSEDMLATFASRNVPESLPHETSAVLYRIAQEALRNVAKHAGKTHVKVTLESEEDGRVSLEVADLGHGFDPDDAPAGLGLISMAERARLIGGKLEIHSALGKGTTIAVDAPIGQR
jgi:two-component system CheB/CheR fusion protein